MPPNSATAASRLPLQSLGEFFLLLANQSVDVQFGLSWDVDFPVGNDRQLILGIEARFVASRIHGAAVKQMRDVGGVEGVEDCGLGSRLGRQKILPGQGPNDA